MKKIFNNKVLRLYLPLMLSTFFGEIIFKISINSLVFDWSLFRIFLSANIFSLFISLLLSLFKKELISAIINIIVSFIVNIIILIQTGFYNYLGTVMSLGASSQADAVSEFVGDFISSFKLVSYLVILPTILMIIYYVIENIIIKKEKIIEEERAQKIKGKKKRKQYEEEQEQLKTIILKNNKKTRIISLIIFIVLLPLYYATICLPFMQNKLQMVSNRALYYNITMPNLAASQYGVLGFEYIDIKTLIFGTKEITETFEKENVEYTDYSRIINDTAWEELQASETDKQYKTLNSYYMSKIITPKNDKTGVFEGKNLVVVMMESGSNVITDYPEFFPNINKLYNEGWAWTNSFSPRNACSTGNNEMTGLTSLFTINKSCTANVYKDNTYFEAMFNLFNNRGYKTTSYHDYTDHYYYRHTIHPNMGSTKFYGVSDLGIKLANTYQPWPSDVEFIEKSLPYFINEENFMVWLTTVSSHMSYKNSSVTGDMYLDMFKNTNFDLPGKRYMSKLKILDNAIGTLIKGLEDAGKLDDTVIVLFADHYPYGLSDSSFSKLANYDIDEFGNVDRTPFIIYNSQIEPVKYEQYTSYLNILPTIANLFNLDYDPRLYGGVDLFDKDYPNYVVFADGSWKSDIAYYDATTSKLTYTGEEKYSDEEILKINNRVKNKIKMNNLAIEQNYFEYLEKKLYHNESEENIEKTGEENN